jgi:uncharacterized protein YoxC
VDPSQVNVLISVSLMLLAVTALLLIGSAIPLLSQASRTLVAYEKLAETLETELSPTLTEVKTMLEGVNQIRQVTTDRVTQVSHQVTDVAGSVGTVADKAKKQSSAWGAGLLAGVRAYLEAGKSEPHARQIASSKGEE